LTLSITFHHQIDGKIEWVNGVLSQYLRNFVSVDQYHWMDYVGLADYNYNVAMHSRTKELPFKVA
jgi:hypothetical protein